MTAAQATGGTPDLRAKLRTRVLDCGLHHPAQPKFVINLKTAKPLGLTIPPSLLLGADQVIE